MTAPLPTDEEITRWGMINATARQRGLAAYAEQDQTIARLTEDISIRDGAVQVLNAALAALRTELDGLRVKLEASELDTNLTLAAIAAFLLEGGSRRCNLHESAGSWAAEELRILMNNTATIADLIADEKDAISAGEGFDAAMRVQPAQETKP